VHVFDFDLDRLREDFAPGNFNQQLLGVAFYNFDRGTENLAKQISQCIFFKLNVLLSDAPVPLINNNVLSCKVLEN